MSRGHLSDALRRKVREAARDRCGYCLSDQRYLLAPLEVEHVVPLSRGGTDEEINLWLSCPRCNRYKGSQVQAVDPVTGQAQKLFHPRQDAWADHFHWE